MTALFALLLTARLCLADPIAPPGPGPKPPTGVVFSVSPTPTQAAPGSRITYNGYVRNDTIETIDLIGLSGTYPSSGFTEDITPFLTDANWSSIGSFEDYEALMFYVDIDPGLAPGDYDIWTDLLWTSESNLDPQTATAYFTIQVRGPAVPEAGTLIGLGLMLSVGGTALWRRRVRA